MKNKQAGFLQLLVYIVIGVFLLSYFHLTVSEAWHWFLNALHNVFR